MPLVGYDVKYENIYLKLQKIFNAIDSRDLNNLYDNFLTSNGYYHCLKSQSQVIENFNLKYTKLTDFELMMLFDVISYLSNDILTKVDRASMSYSLETRAPYLNHHLYEFMCKLPSSFKIKNGKTKRILRSINKKYIPEDLIDQRKVGFGIPIANWMRGKLFEFSHAMVFNNDLKNLNIVDETKLQKIWDDHQSKEYDYSSILWNFVALGAWFDRQKNRYKIIIIGSDAGAFLNFRKELVLDLISSGFSPHILVPDASKNNDLKSFCIKNSITFSDFMLDRYSMNIFKEFISIFQIILIFAKERLDYSFLYHKTKFYALIAAFLTRYHLDSLWLRV